VWGHYDDHEGDIAWHAARNLGYPTICSISCWPGLMQKEWKMPPREWGMAKAQFAILFEGRFRLG
jgi:hypothetical protein